MPFSDIELSDFDDREFTEVQERKKWTKNSSNSSLSAETVCSATQMPEGLTAIFTPVEQNTILTSLSSLKVCLEPFPECILEIRYNNRLNLIAIDARNGQTTRALLDCTVLCGVKTRAYEPLPRHYATVVIRDVDSTLTETEIADNLRSPEKRVVRLRRLSSAIKLSFCGSALPNYVYLGHVRHPVTLFKEHPVQCASAVGTL